MAVNEPIVLRLYIVGGSPNSILARNRLEALLTQYAARVELEIIDVMERPTDHLKDGVIVTPTLVRVSPEPRRMLIGDLSDALSVASILGLPMAQEG